MNTDELLRTLDTATKLTETQQRRADALLERIVRDQAAPSTTPVGVRSAGRRSAWRAGIIVAAVVVVAAIAIGVPGLSPQSAAVASWTPQAEAVSPADLAVAEKACRMNGLGADGETDIPLSISERRGGVVVLLFYRDNPETATSCLLDLPKGADAPREIQGGTGGTSGPAMVAPTNGFTQGAVGQDTLGGQVLSVVSGSVGPGVKSITLQGDGEAATATISDGHYAAWLPGSVFINTDAPSGKGGPEVVISYTLVLKDGTLINDAKSTFP